MAKMFDYMSDKPIPQHVKRVRPCVHCGSMAQVVVCLNEKLTEEEIELRFRKEFDFLDQDLCGVCHRPQPFSAGVNSICN